VSWPQKKQKPPRGEAWRLIVLVEAIDSNRSGGSGLPRRSVAKMNCPYHSLLIVEHYFRYGSAHFNLRAHFLNLRGLLFELRGENIHSFLLWATVDFNSAMVACCSATFWCSLRNSLSIIALIAL